MLFTVPTGMSFFDAGTVTLPLLFGCFNCTWLPLVETTYQPSLDRIFNISALDHGAMCIVYTHPKMCQAHRNSHRGSAPAVSQPGRIWTHQGLVSRWSQLPRVTEKSVQNLLTHCLPNFRLSQLKTLAWAVVGCLTNPRGLLTEIARGCRSRTSLRHKLKRLHRFLSNDRVCIEEHARCLLNWLLALQGRLFTPLIAMDWTERRI